DHEARIGDVRGERGDARRDVDESLAAGRRELRIGAPGGPVARRDISEREAVPFAVVELYEAFVDLDLQALLARDGGRGVARAPERARVNAHHRLGREPASEGHGLVAPELAQRCVEPALQTSPAVELGLAVPDEGDHESSPAMLSRPECTSARRRAA